MDSIKCQNCGAPIKLRPRDLRRGVITCEYCSADYKLEQDNTGTSEQAQAGLKMIRSITDMLGVNLNGALEKEASLNTPAEKPYDSKIELENIPGYKFEVSIPPAGFSLADSFLIMFTLFWCGFMVIWNAIGISQGLWPMVAFGLIHDGVGVFLFITVNWKIFGRERIRTEGDTLWRYRSLFGFVTKKAVPIAHIDGVEFQIRQGNKGRISRPLFLLSGTKTIRIASMASLAEQKWIRTELLKFLNRGK